MDKLGKDSITEKLNKAITKWLKIKAGYFDTIWEDSATHCKMK